MNGCTNKDLGKLLGAYELGILEEKDRVAFEIHLLECEYCAQSYSEYEKVSCHIQYSPTIKEKISAAAAESELAAPETIRKKVRSWKEWRRPVFIPMTAVIIIALLFLLLRPWHLEFRPEEEAMASGNRLAVIDFKNMTDADDSLRLGATVSYLLIANLSEVSTVSLISSERIKDILGSLGSKDSDISDQSSAEKFARRAGARWILYGTIIGQEDKTTLVTQLVDMQTGDVIGAHRMSSQSAENIISLTDRLAELVRKDLANLIKLSPSELESEPKMAARSPEAYRYYLEGLEYFRKLYYTDAMACFEKVLSFDSTFAMAYYYLSGKKDPALIWKAVQYEDNASELERYYIKAEALAKTAQFDSSLAVLRQLVKKYPDEKQAYYQLGSFELGLYRYNKAIDYYSEAIKIDSSFSICYNQLMYAYDRIGNFEMALWAINKYIEQSPDEANPYDSRGELYLNNGMPEKAIESFRKALAIKPDYYSSINMIGNIYAALRNYDAADSCYRIQMASPERSVQIAGAINQALIPYGRGQTDSAIKILDRCLMLNETAPVLTAAARIYYLKMSVYLADQKYGEALKAVNNGMEATLKESPGSIPPMMDYRIQILAQMGRIDEAFQEVSKLKARYEQAGRPLYDYWYGLGSIYFKLGEMDSCIANMKNVVADDVPSRCFAARYWLGRAYLVSGHLADAIDELEKQTDRYDYSHLLYSIWNADLHYYLGIAYENSNWRDKAIVQYRLFMDIMRDANPALMSNYDVAARLARLERQP